MSCCHANRMYHLKPDRVPMEKMIEDMGLEGSSKLWIGKDYCNFIFKDFVKLDQPFEGRAPVEYCAMSI